MRLTSVIHAIGQLGSIRKLVIVNIFAPRPLFISGASPCQRRPLSPSTQVHTESAPTTAEFRLCSSAPHVTFSDIFHLVRSTRLDPIATVTLSTKFDREQWPLWIAKVLAIFHGHLGT
ncbi:hypothetical protein PVAG01_05584 [Phlyctema vagabunda]|uniref:Uncharacterized protein n=1 Tax=Phlyctema vagabunda TaxID=108571 RepID=A0ABR4PKG9_9HELO